ncbi:hypothetical protein QEZ54_13755 [Catellatospora sp. KI3]|uniref:hypothetical protein n=1 Tax=Catellatospora sp. KI3 TaxID=3041620 RepID=UPI0024832A23|nr:hypothetical protein [Catellatospora sp. KI3]MDI1462035.1 hypothetical protein [Catellatospora sp. KI3]
MLRAYFGRHKSASTWARTILHEVAYALNLDIVTIHVPEQWAPYPSLGDFVRATKPGILILTNSMPEWIDSLPEMRAFHLIRDPRDIVVSGYFSHLNSHPEVVGGIPWPELVEHRRNLRRLDEKEGMLAELEFSRMFLEPMAGWTYDRPGVLETKMEDLTTDPVKVWTTILSHLDLLTPDGSGEEKARMAAVRWNLAARRRTPRLMAYPRMVLPRLPIDRLPGAYVADTNARFSFARLAKGRERGQEDVHSHYRRGVAGDWRNHFDDTHLAAFRARYGDLVERLGYDW